MKRLALVAAVLVAACSTKETPKADTAAPAMAPAPAAAVDTAKHDSTAAAKMDTAMKKTDTAMKKMDEAKGAMKDAAKKKKP
jgi:predicted cobalt transporter CbtA